MSSTANRDINRPRNVGSACWSVAIVEVRYTDQQTPTATRPTNAHATFGDRATAAQHAASSPADGTTTEPRGGRAAVARAPASDPADTAAKAVPIVAAPPPNVLVMNSGMDTWKVVVKVPMTASAAIGARRNGVVTTYRTPSRIWPGAREMPVTFGTSRAR